MRFWSIEVFVGSDFRFVEFQMILADYIFGFWLFGQMIFCWVVIVSVWAVIVSVCGHYDLLYFDQLIYG